jgi:uncharacterized membrane protein (DUF4010 family)
VSELIIARNLAVAALAGLAVGIEREWSGHASGPSARFAGVRTFFLLGLLGGLAGWLGGEVDRALGGVLLFAAGSLVIAAYVIAAVRTPEAIDGTTEAAALVVLGLGLTAGLGEVRLASALAAVTVLALGEKQTIHRLVAKLGQVEMQAALRFAVLALVVLPLLPAGPYGPGGVIRPREIWGIVLFFSGLNFLGYLVRRAVGAEKGYPLAGALGGILSSTVVTLEFSRKSRSDPELSIPLSIGTVAACLVLIPRLVVVVAALQSSFAPRVALILGPMFLLGAGLVWFWWRRAAADEPTSAPPPGAETNPLRLGSAIKMAIGFQLVLIGIELAQRRFGSAGVMTGAALVGLTDMDALTLSMSRLAADSSQELLAARALVVGIVTNTLLKSGLAFALGSDRYRRRTVPALLLLAVAGAAGWWLAAALAPPA